MNRNYTNCNPSKYPSFNLTASIVGFLLILLSVQLQAQQVKTTFKIINSKKAPVPFASVAAIQAVDSTQTLQQISDSAGVSFLGMGLQC